MPVFRVPTRILPKIDWKPSAKVSNVHHILNCPLRFWTGGKRRGKSLKKLNEQKKILRYSTYQLATSALPATSSQLLRIFKKRE